MVHVSGMDSNFGPSPSFVSLHLRYPQSGDTSDEKEQSRQQDWERWIAMYEFPDRV